MADDGLLPGQPVEDFRVVQFDDGWHPAPSSVDVGLALTQGCAGYTLYLFPSWLPTDPERSQTCCGFRGDVALDADISPPRTLSGTRR